MVLEQNIIIHHVHCNIKSEKPLTALLRNI